MNGDFVSCSSDDPRAKRFTRETNTMPQWAGSSWYYLRFPDPKNEQALSDTTIEKKWQPVDVYVGGDHATRHLIYARFWHKFLYDIGVVSYDEPFSRLEFLGFILAEDGRKMSKRLGNVINPDDVVARNGADALRMYEMFMAPFEQTVAWDTKGIVRRGAIFGTRMETSGKSPR
jgi:leucyl-tRNA synthetase